MNADDKTQPSGRRVWRRYALVLGIALLFTHNWWFRPLLFDESQPAWDRDRERHKGKDMAWGPRPRQLTLFGHPPEVLFRGDEWQFRLYRDYCERWVRDNGYELVPVSR